MIVFREGLEAVLILAAITASMVGANLPRRREVFLGAAVSFVAAIGTWFAVEALLDVASPLGPKLEAITGFIAIVILLLVLNWFVHKVYWSDWLGRHHRQRRRVLAKSGRAASIGLVALGFTAVYREGFEVVLFEQNLKLQEGSSAVLEGIAIGLVLTAIVGALTFWLHHKLPYRKMLILTGALVAAVLVVMIGGTALSFAELGWIPQTATPFDVPEWMGSGSRSIPTGKRSARRFSRSRSSSGLTTRPSTSRTCARGSSAGSRRPFAPPRRRRSRKAPSYRRSGPAAGRRSRQRRIRGAP